MIVLHVKMDTCRFLDIRKTRLYITYCDSLCEMTCPSFNQTKGRPKHLLAGHSPCIHYFLTKVQTLQCDFCLKRHSLANSSWLRKDLTRDLFKGDSKLYKILQKCLEFCNSYMCST